MEASEYFYYQHGWEIIFICDSNSNFSSDLPEYIRYIPIHMKRGFHLDGIFAMIQMIKIFKKEKFDLVQYSTPNASLYASLSSWIVRIPVRLYRQWGIRYIGLKGFNRFIFKRIEKIVCWLSTMISPDSTSNREFSIKEGFYTKEKSFVIWNGSVKGINEINFDINKKEYFRNKMRDKLRIGNNELVFGYLGRIIIDKGIFELIFAFYRFRKKYPNTKLVLIGSVDDKSLLMLNFLDKAKKCKDIRLVGYTETPEMYYAMFDIFIFPSHREGFGGGVIQAAAMGVPSIVADIPPLLNSIINNVTGLSFYVGDKEDLLHKMVEISNNPERLSDMSRKAYEYAISNYNEHIFMKKYANFLKDLMGVENGNTCN
jgi:glycosyltransferase involved in cell wall biosynthesis